MWYRQLRLAFVLVDAAVRPAAPCAAFGQDDAREQARKPIQGAADA
jgi:hypothetical protein